ncbi:MAG: sensor histidine kinase [Candidatus Cohnella colombiensis]|uniref:Sensor histidine kinase n=1 Tax=Candidatus Cohnella colombiensis TaxID=3121368 RepID=A0AA95JAN0_9BACL|nr:MAG: sensor histidine kinase [Cohnella sp.]
MKKLSHRILAGFIGFIIIPLCVLGSVSYLMFEKATQEKYVEQTELTLRAIGRNMNNMIKEANYFSDFWVTTEDSVESVEQSLDPSSTGFEDSGDPAYLELLEKDRLRQRVLLTYPSLRSVTLYRTDNRIVNVNFSKDKPIAREDLESSPIYTEVIRKNGAPVWIGPNEDPILNGENNFFTQIRVLLDVDTLTSKGILVTRFQMNEMSRIFSFYNGKGQSDRRYLIVRADGKVIFDNEGAAQGRNLAELVDTQKGIDLSSKEDQSSTLNFDGRKSLVTIQDLQLQRLGVGDWKVVLVTSWTYLSGDMALVLKWMVAAVVVTLVLALVYNLMFVQRIVNFIVHIVKAMRKVERGDLTTQVAAIGTDEISMLANGFNRLVTRVSMLLDDVKSEQRRKRKAEMMLLQAQIKPHFLFNALESINILAVQNEGRKVSKMVQRLANIFRISIQQKEEIRIEQELEHLTSYLDIQHYRFEDLFEYEIDIPDDLLGNQILKLTLQPLVENSIQHGFEGIDYMGRITLQAREEGNKIVIFVQDNGIGISSERLEHIVASGIGSIEEMYEETPEIGERRGLGVGNVADRLRIHYGVGYGLIICSAPGYGTIIKCIIPRT